METYSDWEYYSDDYYDDDPTVMKGQGDFEPAGKPQIKKTLVKKKRKLTKTEDIPSIDIGNMIASKTESLFKGVVWRAPSPEDPAPYKTGEREKVALLENWREVFKDSNPKLMTKRMSNARSTQRRKETPDLGLSQSDPEPVHHAEPPKKRKRTVGILTDEPLKLSVASEPKPASARVNGRKAQKKESEPPRGKSKDVQPAQSKKRRAGPQDEVDRPSAKRAAPSKVLNDPELPANRKTRSRKK